jgi:hypothetical protein
MSSLQAIADRFEIEMPRGEFTDAGMMHGGFSQGGSPGPASAAWGGEAMEQSERSRPCTISRVRTHPVLRERLAGWIPDEFRMGRLRPDPAEQVLLAAGPVLAGIIWSLLPGACSSGG